MVKDEKGDLVADSHSIVARWWNYFFQLFNVHGVKDVGQPEINAAEALVPEPSASEVELTIDKLKCHKSPGIDQILAELIKAGGNNYRGISLLPATYKILTNILLSWLIPYAKEIIRDNQCGFRRNRSTIDHIF